MGYQKFLICCTLWYCLVRMGRDGARAELTWPHPTPPQNLSILYGYNDNNCTVRCGTVRPTIETSGLFGMACLDFRTMVWNTYVIYLRALIGSNGLHNCPSHSLKPKHVAPNSSFIVLKHTLHSIYLS